MKTICLFLCCGALFAEDHFNFIMDPHFSPYAGGEDIIEGFHVAEWALDARSASPPWYERLFTQIGFWDPLGRYASTAQHEVFGHGYRVRSLHGHVLKYGVGVPFPYANGGGYTMFQRSPKWTPFQSLAIDSAGMEGTAVLANRLKLSWLKNENLDPRSTVLYLSSQHDLTWYTHHTRDSVYDVGDVKHYVDLLNEVYSDDHLSIKSLKRQAWINLLDPFTYLAMYSWGDYIVRGNQRPVPMIPVGEYGYLPGLRLGLTPFGPEYYLENYLLKGNEPIYAYLRYGRHSGHVYPGIGLEHPSLLWHDEKTAVGVRFDGWYQPHTAFKDKKYSYKSLREKWELQEAFPSSPYDPKVGVAASIMLRRQFSSSGSLFLQVGGKTKGFLPGESLDAAVTVRGGITIW